MECLSALSVTFPEVVPNNEMRGCLLDEVGL